MKFTAFEALARVAHRVAVSEEERLGLTAAFLETHGSDEEKVLYYQETEADKQKREAQEKFDAAVAVAVKQKQDEAAHNAAVQEAVNLQVGASATS